MLITTALCPSVLGGKKNLHASVTCEKQGGGGLHGEGGWVRVRVGWGKVPFRFRFFFLHDCNANSSSQQIMATLGCALPALHHFPLCLDVDVWLPAVRANEGLGWQRPKPNSQKAIFIFLHRSNNVCHHPNRGAGVPPTSTAAVLWQFFLTVQCR